MEEIEWIKVRTDLLDGSSFKFMRTAEIGGKPFRDTLESIWIELLTLAGKMNNSGFLDNEEVDISTYEDLAAMIERKPDEVKLCMAFYCKQKMVKVTEKKIGDKSVIRFLIVNFVKYQNEDHLSLIRKRHKEAQAKYRESIKEIESKNITRDITVTSPVIDSSQEKQDKKKQDTEENTPSSYSVKPCYTKLDPFSRDPYVDFLYEKGFLSDFDHEEADRYSEVIDKLIKEFGERSLHISIKYFVSTYCKPIFAENQIKGFELRKPVENKLALFTTAITANLKNFEDGSRRIPDDETFKEMLSLVRGIHLKKTDKKEAL